MQVTAMTYIVAVAGLVLVGVTISNPSRNRSTSSETTS